MSRATDRRQPRSPTDDTRLGASGDGFAEEFREELADAFVDVVDDRPDFLDCLTGGVGEFPVEVALAGVDGAGVAAAPR